MSFINTSSKFKEVPPFKIYGCLCTDNDKFPTKAHSLGKIGDFAHSSFINISRRHVYPLQTTKLQQFLHLSDGARVHNHPHGSGQRKTESWAEIGDETRAMDTSKKSETLMGSSIHFSIYYRTGSVLNMLCVYVCYNRTNTESSEMGEKLK